jgi:hypothetical protein
MLSASQLTTERGAQRAIALDIYEHLRSRWFDGLDAACAALDAGDGAGLAAADAAMHASVEEGLLLVPLLDLAEVR